jgi:hypothetical protein
MTDSERNEDATVTELLAMNRSLVENNARYAQALAEILRILARDMLTVADLAAPADDLEAAMVRHCRQRAQRLLAGLGDDRVAN